jgi:hypothetical protein
MHEDKIHCGMVPASPWQDLLGARATTLAPYAGVERPDEPATLSVLSAVVMPKTPQNTAVCSESMAASSTAKAQLSSLRGFHWRGVVVKVDARTVGMGAPREWLCRWLHPPMEGSLGSRSVAVNSVIAFADHANT